MLALLWLLGSAALAGYGTLGLGAIAVPLAAAIAAGFAPAGSRPLVTVPLGAALGWAVLLFRAVRAPGFGQFVARLQAMMPVSPTGLALVTLALGAVLGLGGALVGSGLRRPAPPA